MSAITTHVLDTMRGCPAVGVRISLERMDPHDTWKPIAQGRTDVDGRLHTLMPDGTQALPGTYRLVFETGQYFEAQSISTFYPQIVVTFTVDDDPHYHVPLLVSPFGYSTYRGS